MDILIQVGLIILALSILVTIHELGHFWAARIFKMRVESFALFFGPVLFKYKPRNSDTEYQLRSVPLGGFVKISGMLDESMDKEALKEPPKDYEFRAKPRWQRLIVMLGGIIMNIILSCVIFIGYKWVKGDDFVSMNKATWGIEVPDSSAAQKLGFQTGDKLFRYKGDTIKYFNDYAIPSFLVDRGKSFDVIRNGQMVKIDIADDYASTFFASKEGILFMLDGPPKVDIVDSSAILAKAKAKTMAEIPADKKKGFSIQAQAGGMESGDSIAMIDSIPVQLYSQVRKMVGERKNQVAIFTVSRYDSASKSHKMLDLKIQVDSAGKVGFALNMDRFIQHVDYSFGEAIPVGISFAFRRGVVETVKGLVALVTGNVDASKSMSGPIKISKVLASGFKTEGWSFFWFLCGFLSMVLAVMNLLPIPVLDGGHVLFLIIESIIGRDIPEKIKEWAMNIGFVLIILLMGYVLLNDVLNY